MCFFTCHALSLCLLMCLVDCWFAMLLPLVGYACFMLARCYLVAIIRGVFGCDANQWVCPCKFALWAHLLTSCASKCRSSAYLDESNRWPMTPSTAHALDGLATCRGHNKKDPKDSPWYFENSIRAHFFQFFYLFIFYFKGELIRQIINNFF